MRASDSPGIGIADDCELPCKYWELNLGPLRKQQNLLTPEPFLGPSSLSDSNRGFKTY